MSTAVDTDVLKPLRAEAATRFEELGWPTTRMEAWRYTNLAPVAAVTWKASGNAAAYAGNGASLAEHAVAELVFVNGTLASATEPKISGLTVSGFAGASAEPAAEEFLGRVAGFHDRAMTALNLAHSRDGALIVVQDGVVVEGFVHLLFIGEGDGIWSHPRNLIVAGRNSQLTVVETYLGRGGYFTNAVTEIVAEDGAVLDHYKVVTEAPEAFHVGTVHAKQRRSSTVTSRNVALGGAIVRNDIVSELGGEGASVVLDGLFVVNGSQVVDNHTVIDHLSPHCQSTELYKGILDDSSRGVFDGTIIVREGAVKTSSRQTNKNLVLSESAIVDSKPTLEIHNDDVKCNHGSTIGQIDEQALFYLRARGIGADDARNLLVYAFASELVDRMKIVPVAEQVRRALFQQLPARMPERREKDR
jgi:Fe-S cluster assembly protein SufD